MIQVELYKETSCPIRAEAIKKVVRTVLKILNKKNHLSLSVAVVKNSTSRTLNRIWRGIDRPTSVLSFSVRPSSESSQKGKKELFILPPREKNFVGEIIIADSVVKKEAQQNNYSYPEEFNYLFVHGFLHLLGYQHDNYSSRKNMEKQEKRILQKLKIKRCL
ncbi:MAG: rRNA maturation RNase YbeY [Candidatus Kerfeldbacteria bacterium CG_4_10_14_0_8_um_filter_42_10]|uniref:Endoribonuclease YbeY n=1 Tax=Candidatus Kerfeldbacteria bacterium CG_4_10_14_0_8_um_filter_42_10 TaxID=2014248 RepID=A0A2M7RKD2_9BACT|nr:MAG: rRNA maturation RNase YbeY [Candidatus Kerfeldbacteria bacterium CG_4_10_14_0_8_um_filter_42_10]